MKYSLIIPVYNRPDELDELLQSITLQTYQKMEVIVVEDGSSLLAQDVVKRYQEQLDLKYFYIENRGPGGARNYGASHATGEYLIVLDSDCVLPSDYLLQIHTSLLHSPCDAFGGPDRAHDSFTPVQKAINYSMTSFFTTGGIRGGRRKMDKFYPRSYNMGVKKSLYHALGGFSAMRFGEDIDFSIRIFQSGATCRLIPEGWVWHKRRVDWKKFYKQVYNSGMARIHLFQKHPKSLKLVHLLPAVFTLGVFFLLGLSICCLCFAHLLFVGESLASGLLYILSPFIIFSLLIFFDSWKKNASLHVASLSIVASYIQLLGYGMGFLYAWWQYAVRGKKEPAQAFKETFYQ